MKSRRLLNKPGRESDPDGEKLTGLEKGGNEGKEDAGLGWGVWGPIGMFRELREIRLY